MFLSTEFIKERYSYVFKNEFNEREIIGKHLKVENLRIDTWSFPYTKFITVEKTLLLSKDKEGNIECHAFWLDFNKNQYGYNELKKYAWKDLIFKPLVLEQ